MAMLRAASAWAVAPRSSGRARAAESARVSELSAGSKVMVGRAASDP
jgi:hypothetical protein